MMAQRCICPGNVGSYKYTCDNDYMVLYAMSIVLFTLSLHNHWKLSIVIVMYKEYMSVK